MRVEQPSWDGKNFMMVRGDHRTIKVRATIDNGHLFEVGDEVILTVKRNIHSEEMLIQKRETNFIEGYAIFTFLPYDTAQLDFGRYVYDIEWRRVGNKPLTIVEVSDFILKGEVTPDD